MWRSKSQITLLTVYLCYYIVKSGGKILISFIHPAWRPNSIPNVDNSSHHGMAAQDGFYVFDSFLRPTKWGPLLFEEVIHPVLFVCRQKVGGVEFFSMLAFFLRFRVIQELIAFQPIIYHFMCFLETTAGFFKRYFQAPNVFSPCRNQAMLESHLVTDSQRHHIIVPYFMIFFYMM